MSDHVEQAAYIIGPHIGKISVMALTTTTAGLDLSATTELGPDVDKGKMVTFRADGGDVHFFLNDSNAGTADPSATSGNNRTYLLPNGQEMAFFPRAGYHFVRAVVATGTGFLRSYISSKPPNELNG